MRHLLIAAIALFAAAPATAQATQELRSSTGYTLQVPAAWTRLPDSELSRLRQSGPEQQQAMVGNGFEAIYRVRGPSARIPTLIVATFDLGQSLTRAQFREQVTGTQARARMQGATTIARVGVPEWDEENGAVWTRSAHPPDGQKPPFTWSVAMLHPDGRRMISLTYTGAPGEDEARVRADLLAIVRSLRKDAQ